MESVGSRCAIMGRHVDTSRCSDQDQTGEMKGRTWARVVGSWLILRMRSWPFFKSSSDRTVSVFRAEFPYKFLCSSFENLTLD